MSFFDGLWSTVLDAVRNLISAYRTASVDPSSSRLRFKIPVTRQSRLECKCNTLYRENE
jgi:hypothetical protein